MISTSRKLLIAAIGIILISFGLGTPAKAMPSDWDFEFEPNLITQGQAAVVVLFIEECSTAPTNFEVNFRNNKEKYKLTKSNWSFKQTIAEGNYTASWVFTGKGNAGVKAGYVAFDAKVSGGCAEEEIYGDDYESVTTAKDPISVDWISDFSIAPDYLGIKAGWTPVESAIKYEVQIGKTADEIVWQEVGETNNHLISISAEEFNLDYGFEYEIRVRPVFKKSKGEWTGSNGWWGYESRVQAWTSLVGDSDRTEVTEFEDAEDIQFNYKVENCPDPSEFYEPWTVVNEISSKNEMGISGDDYLGLNEYSNSSEFTNYNFDDTGNDLIVSWQTNLDLSPQTYQWGQYFAVQTGCIRDNTDSQFINTWPFSEYSYFKIVKNGKVAPITLNNDSATTHSTESSILFKWGAPLNSNDGPFTYEIYDTNLSEDVADWDLLKTTSKRSYLMKNLVADQEVSLGVIVRNSAGTSTMELWTSTSSVIAKMKSSISKQTLAKRLGLSRYAISISATKLDNVVNACKISKKSIKFGSKIGVCAVRYTWKEDGEDKSATSYIWTKK
ncbi:MAG: hypothetical protein RLZZ330_10 [Actinomycetota bacterium]|jgi:hypothetical protein